MFQIGVYLLVGAAVIVNITASGDGLSVLPLQILLNEIQSTRLLTEPVPRRYQDTDAGVRLGTKVVTVTPAGTDEVARAFCLDNNGVLYSVSQVDNITALFEGKSDTEFLVSYELDNRTKKYRDPITKEQLPLTLTGAVISWRTKPDGGYCLKLGKDTSALSQYYYESVRCDVPLPALCQHRVSLGESRPPIDLVEQTKISTLLKTVTTNTLNLLSQLPTDHTWPVPSLIENLYHDLKSTTFPRQDLSVTLTSVQLLHQEVHLTIVKENLDSLLTICLLYTSPSPRD